MIKRVGGKWWDLYQWRFPWSRSLNHLLSSTDSIHAFWSNLQFTHLWSFVMNTNTSSNNMFHCWNINNYLTCSFSCNLYDMIFLVFCFAGLWHLGLLYNIVWLVHIQMFSFHHDRHTQQGKSYDISNSGFGVLKNPLLFDWKYRKTTVAVCEVQ